MSEYCFKCKRAVLGGSNARFTNKRGWAHRICPRRRLKRGERKRRKIVRHRYGKPDPLMTKILHHQGTMLDERSYVASDGRQILYGEDWKRRLQECLGRDRLCQWPICDGDFVFVCGLGATDADHVIKRSKQRDDRLSNLRSLCRFHHNMRHKEFRTRFHEGAAPNG